MDIDTIQNLQTYITAETNDAAIYNALAGMTENEQARRMLSEIAEDEKEHANEFKRIYRIMTGHIFSPEAKEPSFTKSMNEVLMDRVLDESEDYRKYNTQALKTNNNTALRNAYLNASADENVHAHKIMYILNFLLEDQD